MLDERIRTKLDERLRRYEELEAYLQDPASVLDPRYPDRLREHGTLGRELQPYQEYLALEKQIQEYRELLNDKELGVLVREELPVLEAKAKAMAEEILDRLVGDRADDSKNVIVEIRAGTGGDEAAIFAGDLFRMYRHYAESRGWRLEEISASPSERGGFKEIIFGLQGENVYRDMKYEAGGHRVQRVPETESQGRIHTSAATVAVLPEMEEYEVELKPEDLKIDIQASGGPGGQSVNTTNSAVRITHIPTGIVVMMQEEKSQHKNKAKALRILRSRVYELKKREAEEKRAAERRMQTGSGDRSERIRTYNFPQNRCTDHRLGRNFSLDEIIEGRLDKLIEALVAYGKEQAIAEKT